MNRLLPSIVIAILISGCDPTTPAPAPPPPSTTVAPTPPPPPTPDELLAAADAASRQFDSTKTPEDGEPAITRQLEASAACFDAERWEDAINAAEAARIVATALQDAGHEQRLALIHCYRQLARATEAGGSARSAVIQAMRAAAFANQIVIEAPDDMTLALLRGDAMLQLADLHLAADQKNHAWERYTEAVAAYDTVLFYEADNMEAKIGRNHAQAVLVDLPPPPPPDPDA